MPEVGNQLVEVVKVTELNPLALALDNYFAHCGADGILGKIDIQGLTDFLVPLIANIGATPFIENTGSPLPNPVDKESGITIVGAGTFDQTTGSDIVTTEALNVLFWDGTSWSVGVEVPVDFSDYYTREETDDTFLKIENLNDSLETSILGDVTATVLNRTQTSNEFSTRYKYGTHFYAGTDFPTGSILSKHLMNLRTVSAAVTLRYRAWIRLQTNASLGPGASAYDTLVADITIPLADLGVTPGDASFVEIEVPLDYIEVGQGEAYGYEVFCLDVSNNRAILGTGVTTAVFTPDERKGWIRTDTSDTLWTRVDSYSIAGKLVTGVSLVRRDKSSQEQDSRLDKLEQRSSLTNQGVRLDVLPFFVSGENGYNGKGYTQCATATVENDLYVVAYSHPDISNNVKGHLFIAKKTLPIGNWQIFDLYSLQSGPTQPPLYLPVELDSHNVAAMIIDKNGYIHIAANMHGDSLKYVKSNSPYDITSWSQGAMGSGMESSISYPRFVEFPDGTIGFHYRNGASGAGNSHFRIYNPDTVNWTNMGMIANGVASNESSYENHIVVDKAGRIWLSYSWRADGSDTNTTSDIYLIYSDDKGSTLKSLDGGSITKPLTHTANNARILNTGSVDSGISNQYGFCLDLERRPHFATHLADGDELAPDRNIHHIWWNGSEWVNDQVTNLKNGLNLLKRPTRPTICCSEEGRLLIGYTTKSWGPDAGYRMIDVTGPHPIEFSICDIPGLDFDLVFEDTALKEQNLFRALIGICNLEQNNPSPDYHSIDNFQRQFAGVLTIDLSQIDKLMAGHINIPRIEPVSNTAIPTSTAVADTSGARSAVAAMPHLLTQMDARNKIVFMRLSARATPSAIGLNSESVQRKLTLQVREDQVTSGGTSTNNYSTLLSWFETSSSARQKCTVWVPLTLGPYNGLEGRLVLYAQTDGGITGTITAANIELGVLNGPVYR